MRNITIRDIARQAGVSKSTISRVINNVGNVNEDLRRRVNNVVTEAGYGLVPVLQTIKKVG